MKPWNIYQELIPPTVIESNNYNLGNTHNIGQPANQTIIIPKLNCIRGVLVSVLTSSVVDCGFEPWSG